MAKVTLCKECRSTDCRVPCWTRRESTLFVVEMATFAGVVAWATHWMTKIKWRTAIASPRTYTIKPSDYGKPPRVVRPWEAEITVSV